MKLGEGDREMSYKLLGEGLLVRVDELSDLPEIEAIIFDVDGTLVDVKKSYYLAIKLTTCIILDGLYGIECKLGDDVNEAIELLKALGGFNNDWNISSILTQAIFLFAGKVEKSGCLTKKIKIENYLDDVVGERSAPEYVEWSIEWIRETVRRNFGKHVSREDFESILDGEAERTGRGAALKDLRSSLGPLTIYGSGLLTTLFDEIYLGEEGIRTKYGIEPRHVSWQGAILNEKLLIKEETLKELVEAAPKGLAIVTGRGKWESSASLRPILEYFDLESSIFMGDAEWPGKPDPTGLIKCAKAMNAEKVIYVGDSAEDLLTVRNAREKGLDALFAGVLTNEHLFDFFLENKAEIIMEDINDLPKTLKERGSMWKPF